MLDERPKDPVTRQKGRRAGDAAWQAYVTSPHPGGTSQTFRPVVHQARNESSFCRTPSEAEIFRSPLRGAWNEDRHSRHRRRRPDDRDEAGIARTGREDGCASRRERAGGAFPGTRVVKTLNTMNTNVMVDPRLVPGDSETPSINFHIARP